MNTLVTLARICGTSVAPTGDAKVAIWINGALGGPITGTIAVGSTVADWPSTLKVKRWVVGFHVTRTG